MESFAGYSFCKAHSASYAVESFQDLYLPKVLERLCMESAGVKAHVDGHQVVKVIVVPDKLVNVGVR